MFRTKLSRFGVSAFMGASIAASAATAATLTAEEHFDYSPGTNIEGQSGGSGWASGSAWSADADGTFVADAGSLTYPGVSDSGNKALITPGSATSTYFRNLDQTLTDGDTFYVGYVAQKLVANDNARYFGVALFLNSGEKINIGQGSGIANWSINHVATPYGLASNTLVSSISSQTQSYVLARIDLRPGVETITYWINPDLSKGELENTPVGGGSFITDSDFTSINRVRLGGGGTSGEQVAATHLLDSLKVSTTSPFAAGSKRLFFDNGEGVAAGSTPIPTFGTYSPTPYTQKTVQAGVGTASNGQTTPASPNGGSNLMILDRGVTPSPGRRNYGAFAEAATGAGTVHYEVDLVLQGGQLQFGLGSNDAGWAIDGVLLTIFLNLNANGTISVFNGTTTTTVAGVSHTLGQWQHYIIEYELGATEFTLTAGSTTVTIGSLANAISVSQMNRIWLTAGTSSTVAYYDNAEVLLLVPEPASMMLGMAGMVMIVVRRRPRPRL